ncbi:MAG: PAS domain-containing protein [Gammaproteobacteria bacterium]|nr:PAS domain-containing protein [Gammaproteobacteria bacterium]
MGYWRFDEVAHEYLDISDEYAEIYGYSVQDFLHRYRHLDDDMTLVHDDDREGLYEAYEVGEGKLDYVYRMRHKDGHWIHVREIPNASSPESSIVLFQQNIMICHVGKVFQLAFAKHAFLYNRVSEVQVPGFEYLVRWDQAARADDDPVFDYRIVGHD